MKYAIGDMIVYPFYGAGIIEDIVEKDIVGEKRLCYLLRLDHTNMEFMIPIESVDSCRIRRILDKSDSDKVYEFLYMPCAPSEKNWNKKHKENMEKLKTGDIFDAADVYKYLRLREKTRNLSTGEKKLMVNSKNVLLSELTLSSGDDILEIENRVNSIIDSFAEA